MGTDGIHPETATAYSYCGLMHQSLKQFTFAGRYFALANDLQVLLSILTLV
jgi:hypothetical protein